MQPKPIRVVKEKGAYFLFVKGAPVVKYEGKLNFDRSVAGVGSDSLPILNPHRFKTKDEAMGSPPQIGRYILTLRDFVYTYVDYEGPGKKGA